METINDQLIRLIFIAIILLCSIAIIGLIGSIKVYRENIKSLKDKISKIESSGIKVQKITNNEKKSLKR